MSNCKNCEASINQLEGRRKREFCDNKGKCRGEYHRKQNKKTDFVSKEKFDALKKERDELLKKISKGYIPEKRTTPDFRYESPVKESHPYEEMAERMNQNEILSKIAEMQSEKIPPERNTQNGRPVWKNEQARKIKELELLLT